MQLEKEQEAVVSNARARDPEVSWLVNTHGGQPAHTRTFRAASTDGFSRIHHFLDFHWDRRLHRR